MLVVFTTSEVKMIFLFISILLGKIAESEI